MIIGYVLLALGIAVFVLSYIIPARAEEDEKIEFSEDIIRDIVNREMESAKDRINDIIEETVNYAMEKTERSVDKLTNEKMLAVNEYSQNVLTEIDKNHQEVVFLYDMLNDKQENLKDTVSEVEKRSAEAKQMVEDAEIKATKTMEQVSDVRRMSAIELLSAANQVVSSPEVSKENVAEEADFKRFEPERITRINSENVVNTVNENDEDNKEAWAMMAPDDISLVAPIEEEKKPRKKRTSKPRVKDEAVSFDGTGVTAISEDNGIIFEKEAAKVSKDAPDLNLGSDVSGQVMGGRNNNERILELHNAGKSNMAIARELGLGIGEVKLVIGLYEGM